MKPGESSIPAVELRGVGKRFGSRVILDQIDLTVSRGEVLVLVGPSGSGKSTLLKIISGIESPDRGQVLLAGNDCTTLPPYRRAVHTVFQNYALFPHLSVWHNVAFPLTVVGTPKLEQEKLVGTALEWVKLSGHAQRGVTSLSGGERQRVALARALVDSPQCVLLDEPLSALDPNLRAETLDLLESIQTRLETTFIFITHDRDEALRLGHRIGVLNSGRLEQVDKPEEVYRRPQTAFVASFLGRINWLKATGKQNHGTLLVADQQVPCKSPAGTNGDWQLGIRPEDVQIDDAGWLAATVVSRQFCGDVVTIRVALVDGTVLIADHRGAACELRVGQPVRISWHVARAHLFPNSSAIPDNAPELPR